MSINPLAPSLAAPFSNPTAPVLGPQAGENAYRWATVTQRTPSFRIRLDGDADPLPLTPDSLIETGIPAVGARVWVQLFGRRVIVLGVAPQNGVPAPGAYVPWTPSFVGLGPGGGAVVEGWYSRIGDTINWQMRAQMGTSPTLAAEVTMTLPVPAFVGGGDGLQQTLGGWILRILAINPPPLRHYAGSVGSYNAAGTTASFAGVWRSDISAPSRRLGSLTGPGGGVDTSTSYGNPYTGGADVLKPGDSLSAGGTYRAA